MSVYSLFGKVRQGLAAVVCVLGLLACNSALPTSQTVTPSVDRITPSPTATSTPAPSPTSPPPLAVLVAPPGGDEALSSELQSLLAKLSGEAGMRFQVRSALSASDLDTGLRLVVAIAPDPGLKELSANAPETQFLAVGIPGVESGPNLTVIGAQGQRPDRQGFLAGYMAAAITPDWRVGVISLEDTPGGRATRQAFINGAVFFCGLCRPSYPPFYQYPLYAEVASDAGQGERRAAVDYLIDHGVKTIYVYPGAWDEALLSYLANVDANIIGGVAPPAGMKDHWVATIYSDPVTAVEETWPGLLKEEKGTSLEAPMLIANANPDLLSPGRQRLVEETLADLTAGVVDTGVDPITGEER